MTFSYQGSELDVFQHAVNWKTYYASRLRRFVVGDTLEVGAGIGATSRFLCDGTQQSWTCLEPDAHLLDRLRESFAGTPLPVPTRLVQGSVADLTHADQFDTLLYIDVLEHIEDDRGELARSAGHVRPGGRIIVLSPAHNWLFSPFDRAIGHYRRYSTTSLAAVTPPGLELTSIFYLDSVGLLASCANRLFLKESSPTVAQIRFWDGVLVRMSRLMDPLTGGRLGKTVIAVWTKTSAHARAATA
jgi:SAM-dependent methyltransferase